MTEIEFKAFMLELISIKSAVKPTHLINVKFFGSVSNEQVESFVDELNDYLEIHDFGVCDIWGINENLIGGIFYLKLNGKANFSDLIDKLKAFSTSYSFLGTVTINVKFKEGDFYMTESIQLGNHDEVEFEDYPDLPVPERVISKDKVGKGGCLGPLSLLITICLLFLIIVIVII